MTKKKPNPNPTLAELRSKAKKVVETFPQQRKPNPELSQAVSELSEILDRPTGRPGNAERHALIDSHEGKTAGEISRLTGIPYSTVLDYQRKRNGKV